MSTKESTDREQENRPVGYESDRQGPSSGVERAERWNRFHCPEGSCSHLVERAKNRIRKAPLPEILGAVAAGFALGWLVFSQRRNHHSLREVFMGSLVPGASKGMHDAWDKLRSSELVSDLGERASKLRSGW